VVDKYSTIPQYWINQVKKMWFNLPGESHSQAYRTGLGLLEALDPRFATDATSAYDTDPDPVAWTDEFLRASRRTWHDGYFDPWGDGEYFWYTSSASFTQNKVHIDHCEGAGMPIGAYGFGWCWDMSRNGPGGGLDPVYKVHWAGSSEGGPQGDLRWGLDSGDQALTGNTVCMNTYLAATQAYADYCASQGYATKVFFTTGPADDTGEVGYQREVKHEYIRAYVSAEASRVLFDYADILSYSDAGVQATTTWTDGEATVHVYQVLHPDNSGEVVGHISAAGALRLGKAIWWMLARIAGWDGNP
jgi:hypothetical protein